MASSDYRPIHPSRHFHDRCSILPRDVSATFSSHDHRTTSHIPQPITFNRNQTPRMQETETTRKMLTRTLTDPAGSSNKVTWTEPAPPLPTSAPPAQKTPRSPRKSSVSVWRWLNTRTRIWVTGSRCSRSDPSSSDYGAPRFCTLWPKSAALPP